MGPIHSRSMDSTTKAGICLNYTFKVALQALLALLDDIQPRFIPLHLPEQVTAVIYADAYFVEGKMVIRAGHAPPDTGRKLGGRWQNGWGMCCEWAAKSSMIMAQFQSIC